MSMTGYGGRILQVDLTSGRSEIRPLDEATARAFLGGNGLAARLLWDGVPPGVEPYDPRNAVALAVGPVTDTIVPGNSRACIATKSPLTGLFFDSTFGGRFPVSPDRSVVICHTVNRPAEGATTGKPSRSIEIGDPEILGDRQRACSAGDFQPPEPDADQTPTTHCLDRPT